jgi:hypothetical protein
MLSAQADELRELAEQLQEHGTFVGFGGTTNTDPLMHSAAMAMREAADTILSLRDKAQELQAENAKLRAERDHMLALRGIWQENDVKLRELCSRFAEYVSQDRCEGCACKRRCDNGEIDECWQRTEIREAAHELGIEVD